MAAVLKREVGKRPQFLDEACHGDEYLRREVESLLAHGEAESFLEQPIFYLTGEDPKDRREGDLLDRYRLIRRVGYGGMGTVYLAVRADDEFQREVAIKMLRWHIDEDLVSRFRVERQILARLDHPNIARLYDGGTIEGRPYLVMEYVEGEPIDRYCDSKRLSVSERLNLFRAVCSAVHFAHQNLIVHRDLKPSNILVTSEGIPKLLDFGIAKILTLDGSVCRTVTGLLPMTPDYASPEQIRGADVTTTSDIYSLGVILYELLTGRRPHLLQSRLPEEVVRVVLSEEPERPSAVVDPHVKVYDSNELPGNLSQSAASQVRGGDPAKLRRRLAGDIDNIVLMALRKEPERRYSSASQFSEDIRRHIDGLPVLARKDTLSYRSGKFIRRHRFAVAAATLMLLLAVGFIAGLLLQRQRALRERDKAERIAEFLVEIFKASDPAESRGDVITAREILDQGTQSVERQLADQPEIQAAMMNTLGEVYASIGLYEQAETLILKSLEIRRTHLEPGHPDIADSLDNLATVYTLEGKYKAAEPLYRESLTIFRRSLGVEHPRTTETLSNYGTFLLYKGDYSAAEPILREVLERGRRIYGTEDERVAGDMSNLASLLKIQGKYQEAKSLYAEALRIRRKLHGEEHSSVATTLNNLGWLFKATGDSVRARALYLEALRLRRKILGPDHPEVATTLHNLANVFEETGDISAAEHAAREAQNIMLKKFGPEHPLVASGFNQLGILLRRKGDLDGAEQMLRDCLAMRQRLLPKKHRDIMVSLNNLAIVLQDKHAYPEAERLYSESLHLRRELWGNEHRDVAVALNNLGTLHEDMGDLREAERLYREALAIRHRLLGSEHPDVLASIGNIASVLSARGKSRQAEGQVSAALQIAGKVQSPARELISQLQGVQGECLLKLERYKEAEPLLLKSYSEIRIDFGDKARPTQKALGRIVALYRALGQTEKTREYEALLTN